jgi:hypothetical protein
MVVPIVGASPAMGPKREDFAMTTGTILLIIAFICFVLAAVGVGPTRINLTAAGLACAVASVLAGTLTLG